MWRKGGASNARRSAAASILHHMVLTAVVHGVGEGRSALLCVWLDAAADKRSAVARLYKTGELFGSRLSARSRIGGHTSLFF